MLEHVTHRCLVTTLLPRCLLGDSLYMDYNISNDAFELSAGDKQRFFLKRDDWALIGCSEKEVNHWCTEQLMTETSWGLWRTGQGQSRVTVSPSIIWLNREAGMWNYSYMLPADFSSGVFELYNCALIELNSARDSSKGTWIKWMLNLSSSARI